MTGTENNRELSPTEKFFWHIDKVSRINFTIHALVDGVLTEKVMRAALNCIQSRHPMLRVKIQRQGWSGARFESGGVPEIPLLMSNAPEKEWISHAEEEINKGFTTEIGPLVRCVVIRHSGEKSTILLTFHHAIGDGISGAFLMRDLLRSASAANKGESPDLPALEPKKEMDAYYPASARGWQGRWLYYRFAARLIGMVIQYGLRMIFKYGPAAMPKIDKKAPLKKRKAHIISYCIDEHLLQKLNARTRLEKTTIHGAMSAALLLAVASDREAKKALFFLLGSPVNLRDRLEPPVGGDVGLFVTMGVSANLAGPGSDFWQLAREVKRSLLDCVEKGEPFVYTYQHKDLAFINKLFGSGETGGKIYAAVADKMNQGLGFTNLGRLAIEPEQGDFFIKNMGFVASGSALASFICFASTINDRLTWNFMGMEPVCSREHTRRIADKALDILKVAILP